MRASVASPYVSAEIACGAGQVLAVTGPNGSGKSSLLRALAGLLPGATVTLGGRDLTRLPPYQRDVGWVPQHTSLLPHLSARDNAAYGLRARRIPRQHARATAQEWLERLGVGDLGDLRPAALSGGQAARVALARALAPQPALYLLDEPLAAVDRDSKDAVRRTLRATLQASGSPALVVTHDPLDVAALADAVLALEGGRVVTDPTTLPS
jgi:molybdate transport system permease protein